MQTCLGASYRVQLNAQFGLRELIERLPYLEKLGIRTLYLSPVLQAKAGSLHGYDGINPLLLNPELGTESDFEELSELAHRSGMKLLLDIVPNHLAVDSSNPTWMDVLENGPESKFAHWYDIEWKSFRGSPQKAVLLPVLGRPFHECLEAGEIKVTANGGLPAFGYYEHRFPMRMKTLYEVLHRFSATLSEQNQNAFEAVLRRFSRIPRGSLKEGEFERELEFKTAVKGLLKQQAVNTGFEEWMARADLKTLLDDQYYHLAYWKTGRKRVNYRRFFNINGLISLRVHDERVLQETHEKIFDWIQKGRIDALRIDHVDGLANPGKYLRRLHEEVSGRSGQPSFSIYVEKILFKEEELPESWQVQGTTGYDFLNRVNSLFVDPKGFSQIQSFYRDETWKNCRFHDVVLEAKKEVLRELFTSRMKHLTRGLQSIADQDLEGRDLDHEGLARALLEITAQLEVYRTYPDDPENTKWVSRAVSAAAQEMGEEYHPHLKFIKRLLCGTTHKGWLKFWQQTTGPSMAKGHEDTALYRYYPLLSLNEVGGEPQELLKDSFEWFEKRARSRAQDLNATATHDTKRGEDTRARLNVLCSDPKHWLSSYQRWKKKVPFGDENLKWLFLQALISVIQGGEAKSKAQRAELQKRMEQYLLKATREAKLQTDWIHQNAEFEKELLDGVRVFFDSKTFASVCKEAVRYSKAGMENSVSQTILKCTLPGVPDFYQGTELWDFSLVDPDNRRPVDFALREKSLNALVREVGSKGKARVWRGLLKESQSWESGRIKLYVVQQLLRLRNECPEIFEDGVLIPLKGVGKGAESWISFMRWNAEKRQGCLVVAPKASLVKQSGVLRTLQWRMAGRLDLSARAAWKSLFSDREVDVQIRTGKLGTQISLEQAELKRERYLVLRSS